MLLKRIIIVLVVSVALALTGCLFPDPDSSEFSWPCKNDSQCIAGWQCASGLCVDGTGVMTVAVVANPSTVAPGFSVQLKAVRYVDSVPKETSADNPQEFGWLSSVAAVTVSSTGLVKVATSASVGTTAIVNACLSASVCGAAKVIISR